jgi:hypothetical protein
MSFTKNYICYNNLYFTTKYNFLSKLFKKSSNVNTKTFALFNIYSIFFLKKERIYTKLKYSRVPLFDTTSGAIASLLAALLGFLITEKFGFELIDSGDFYTIIMYSIFILLILRLAIRTLDSAEFQTFSFVSINNFINFYVLLFKLIQQFMKKIYNQLFS